MNEPIKVIWKYKNNNRKIHYNLYIFVGNVSTEIKKVLEKIKNLTLIDTFKTITKDQIKTMEIMYGSQWYTYFFNIHHLNECITQIKSTDKDKILIIKNLGKDWYEKNIEKYEIEDKKLIYNYDELIRIDLEKDLSKKERLELLRMKYLMEEEKVQENLIKEENNSNSDLYYENEENEPERDNIHIQNKHISKTNKTKVNYSKSNKKIKSLNNLSDLTSDIDNLSSSSSSSDESNIITDKDEINDQDGGAKEEKEYDSLIDGIEIDMGEIQDVLVNEDDGELLLDDQDIDIDQEIADIYKEEEVTEDDDLKSTKKTIQKILRDSNYIESFKNNMIEFDITNDDVMFDMELKDIFTKNYVFTNFIYKDDNIKNIKNKICCNMLNNNKYMYPYLLPSRQYLWSEYNYEGETKKIMIGQKWVKRTELLNIEIEPIENIRYYEDLRGNLGIIYDTLRRYGSKVRREDDEGNLLSDYENFYRNNELYMIDIYNDLGLDYKTDENAKKNMIDVYFKIYYPKIKQREVDSIINFLNNSENKSGEESATIKHYYPFILNDLILENEVTDLVEDIRTKIKSQYKFQDSYITQSVIHLRLRILNGRLDLYRIFNNFVLDDNYHFVQFQTQDNKSFFKINDDKLMDYYGKELNKEVLVRWFESTITSQYGISFKVKVNEKSNIKFIVINLTENGRLEYKTQWKETDNATVNDIRETYILIRNLIEKMNLENTRIKFAIPLDTEFKFAFINSIQKFELPDNYEIDHNDLSEFARFFFPYISLVIEPRKRVSKFSKDVDKSKYGTYLRYKRVTKYDNMAKIEKRIIYFIKNYDVTMQVLINEISKQFNITEEHAQKEIEYINAKYPSLKKARKELKKMELMTKYKLPGIGIDIQGKQKENYKIRISGARSIDQLNRITQFMNVLIYLYIETYLLKIPDRMKLKLKLSELTNVASRRKKVSDIVKRDNNDKNIKQIIKLDKKRLGFKPEEGQNQWSRACQNSGTKRRRPYPIPSVDELLKDGFKLNKTNGMYEKNVIHKGKKKTIRSVKLSEINDEGKPTGNSVYYSCSPKENGEYIYIGFLTKSRNPFGLCMPCCFKKDPYDTTNKKKHDFFMKCIGNDKGKTVEDDVNLGDVLYILQDTNKLQENRFSFLPRYLDIYLNKMQNLSIKMDQHYLSETYPEYYFKLGVSQEGDRLLNTISVLTELSNQQIIKQIRKTLTGDENNIIFTYLNSGETKNKFRTKEKYIQYLKLKESLEFTDIVDIFKIPDVITKNGVVVICFKKTTTITYDKSNKANKRDDFEIVCNSIEDSSEILRKDIIVIINEDNFYYPIVSLNKKNDNLNIVKIYNKSHKLINHIYDYYSLNCKYGSLHDTLFSGKNQLTAHQTKLILDSKIDVQIIDSKNKAYYLVIKNNLIPIKRSGTLHDIEIKNDHKTYIKDFNTTIDYLTKIAKDSKDKVDIKPIGVLYTHKSDENITISDIVCKNGLTVAIKSIKQSISNIKNKGLSFDKKTYIDIDDLELKALNEDVSYIDERVNSVNLDKYKNETYQLFKLETSTYLTRFENRDIRTYLLKVLNATEIARIEKRDTIKGLFYFLVDNNLGKLYLEIKKKDIESISSNDISEMTEKIGKTKSYVHLVDRMPNLNNYRINNIREACSTLLKRKCVKHLNCDFINDECMMILTKENAIEFVNRLVGELLSDDTKIREIFRIGGYSVLDIVDRTRFTERNNEKIITYGVKVDSTLLDLLKLGSIDTKKKRNNIDNTIAYYNHENMLKDLPNYKFQRIINNDNTLIRAYANCYYWILVPYQSDENRNLGYYSILQTDISNFLKGVVIDWMNDPHNLDEMKIILDKYLNINLKDRGEIRNFTLQWASETDNTRCLLELYILSKIYNVPIQLCDQNDKTVITFNNGDNKISASYKKTEIITIRIYYGDKQDIPYAIDAIYQK